MHRTLQRAVRTCLAASALLSLGLSLSGCFLFPNAPPAARFTATPEEGHAPLTVRFDASVSHDSDGIITSYAWSFGDGANGSGATPEHRFAVPGTYVVTLTATDDDRATAQASRTIRVGPPDAPPVASFTLSPSSAEVGELVSFNATMSRDPDGRILSYTWGFGDGAVGSGVAVRHAYAAAATYTVTLTVADDDGATDTEARTVSVTTRNQPPIASFTVSPSPAGVSLPVRYDGSASYDPDGRITSYVWDFGDGESGQGAVATHSYRAAGSYVVRLSVTDDRGATGTATRGLTVSETLPGGGVIERHYEWRYKGLSHACDLSIPASLYENYHSRLRGPWTNRDYDEYVLDPLDDDLLRTLASAIVATSGSDYYQIVESALAFVQAVITYALDPGPFEYPRYPVETLVDLVGDCEDTAILYASLVRTLGQGALIVAVDTDKNGQADHMVTFVPVDQAYADAATCPQNCSPSFWEYGGRLYALAETAVDGGYIPLGCDPWGLQAPDLKEVWDVSGVDLAPHAVKWTKPQ
jgi:PKD repeat protein